VSKIVVEYQSWRDYDSSRISELEGLREQNSSRISELEGLREQNSSRISELEGLREQNSSRIEQLMKNNHLLDSKQSSLTQEINEINNSIAYIIAKDATILIDKKLSPNSKLGKFVRNVVYKKYKNRISQTRIDTEFSYKYEFDDFIDDEKVTEIISNLSHKPKISIIMPVYNTETKILQKAIESVKKQYYYNWQLCICDDHSTGNHIEKILKKHSGDNRIDVIFSKSNEGISLASNKALSIATGEYILLLDHDDELAKNALLEVVKKINEDRDVDFIYSDEDKIDDTGNHIEPFFKPDWSPDLFFCYNYPIHVSIFKKSILKEIGGFRKGFDGAQDYDLILRYLEKIDKISHIPKVLYSWRKIEGSTALNLNQKSYAYNAGKKALKEAIKRRGIDASCEEGLENGTYRIKYNIQENPLISIIIPSKSIKNISICIKSIVSKSTYTNFEIIIMDSSNNDEIKRYSQKFSKIKHEKIKSKNFNFSKINNDAVKKCQGDYVLFLNDDTKIITNDWIERLLEHAQREEIGVVGSKLLYDNDHVQHAGTIIGIQHHAGNYGGMYKNNAGYFSFANIIRNCSAVTAACMMMKKIVFEKIGGFDEKLARSWQDVDLCIRVINSGKLIVYTPYSMLYHYEGTTRGNKDSTNEELEARGIFRTKHKSFIENGDSFYNPNLSLANPFRIGKSNKKPLKVLSDMYEQRDDLRKAFPNDHNNEYQSVVDWVVTHGIIMDSEKEFFEPYYEYYYKNCSEKAKPLAKKIHEFLNNKELQNTYTEVWNGNFSNLLKHTQQG
jgi:glycosyltransferase involved in cell wall biosynthesis